ncbi:MAG TPA: hypothetical protein VEA16_17590 [Vicinamibacterales bacterium]|nr:hypothetical protein [Vicinamibacterales bacterium]
MTAEPGTPEKEERDLQLLIEDNKGAFDTFDQWNSELIVRRAKRWNIHVPADWLDKDGKVRMDYRHRVTRMTNEASGRYWNRIVFPAAALVILAVWIFGDDFIWDTLFLLFG